MDWPNLSIIGLLGMVFAGVVILLFIIQSNSRALNKIYVQQRTLMAFLLKEYEERERVNLADYGTQNADGTISPPPAVTVEESAPTLSEKEIDAEKRRAAWRKKAEKKKAAKLVANGT